MYFGRYTGNWNGPHELYSYNVDTRECKIVRENSVEYRDKDNNECGEKDAVRKMSHSYCHYHPAYTTGMDVGADGMLSITHTQREYARDGPDSAWSPKSNKNTRTVNTLTEGVWEEIGEFLDQPSSPPALDLQTSGMGHG